jgi:excisionase family DNA binding protein
MKRGNDPGEYSPHADCGFANTQEAAAFLGLSKSMINKLVAAGEIPSKRYGRALRIPWAWLRAEAQQAA